MDADVPSLLQLRACRVDLRTRSVLREDRGARLSTKEAELLVYLTQNPARAISREELLQEVWGYDPSVISRTADTTIQRLRSKIERNPRQPEHILTEHGHGYRFEPLAPDGTAPSLPIARSTETSRTNFRADPTPFVGRERDLARVADLLGPSRLVTLRGPGGAGKTRLARRAALDALRDGIAGESLSGGAYFVDLAPASTEDDVVRVVASSLALSLVLDHRRHDAISQIGHAIADRGPLVLVFDNCEQIVAPAAHVAGRLMDVAPDMRIIATSREALHLTGERVLELGPMTQEEASELFAVRARAVRPDFRVDDAGLLGRLVDALDRLPLAIELAAARSGLLAPERILERLQERFRLLSRGPRDATPRHRTLRATIDWSWNLLDDDERTALTWCAVFRGAFPVEAAEYVLLGAHPDDDFVLDVLETLRERSLLRAHAAPEDPETPRLRLFESVRAYAEEKLDEAGEADAARARHRDWMVQRAEELATAVDATGGDRAMARLGLLLDDLLAVVDRHAEDAPEIAVRAALATVTWLYRQGPMRTHQEVLDRAVSIAAAGNLSDSLRARVHMRRSIALRHQGRAEEGYNAGEQALELAQRGGDAITMGEAMVAIAALQRNRGRTAESDEMNRKALALHLEHGHRLQARRAKSALAFTAWKQGRFPEGEELYRDVLAEARADDDQAGAATALTSLGLVLLDQGRPKDAEGAMLESLELHEAIRDRRGAAVAAGNLARLAVNRGQVRKARARYQECLLGLRAMGDRRLEGVVTRNLGVLCMSKGLTRQAEEHFRMALAIARETDDQWNVGSVLSDLGEVLMHEGRHAEAAVRYQEALVKAEEVGDHRNAAIIRGNLSVLHHQRGELDTAAALNRLALGELGELGLKRAEGYFEAYGALLCAERGELERARTLVDSASETLHTFGDVKGKALTEMCSAGVRLVEARTNGTTEQRETAEDRAQRFAEEPDPDVSSDTLHSADTDQGRRLLRRLLDLPPS
ncbi:MAG: tetratricopeptide repeat protein [Deltaproteobacteria bacterium]|nr:tetratricopeptide repeat protein [Deltaproteobacteria bacterium]